MTDDRNELEPEQRIEEVEPTSNEVDDSLEDSENQSIGGNNNSFGSRAFGASNNFSRNNYNRLGGRRNNLNTPNNNNSNFGSKKPLNNLKNPSVKKDASTSNLSNKNSLFKRNPFNLFGRNTNKSEDKSRSASLTSSENKNNVNDGKSSLSNNPLSKDKQANTNNGAGVANRLGNAALNGIKAIWKAIPFSIKLYIFAFIGIFFLILFIILIIASFFADGSSSSDSSISHCTAACPDGIVIVSNNQVETLGTLQLNELIKLHIYYSYYNQLQDEAVRNENSLLQAIRFEIVWLKTYWSVKTTSCGEPLPITDTAIPERLTVTDSDGEEQVVSLENIIDILSSSDTGVYSYISSIVDDLKDKFVLENGSLYDGGVDGLPNCDGENCDRIKAIDDSDDYDIGFPCSNYGSYCNANFSVRTDQPVVGSSSKYYNFHDGWGDNYYQCPWYAKRRAYEIIDTAVGIDRDLKDQMIRDLYSANGNGTDWYALSQNGGPLSKFNSSDNVYDAKPGAIVSWASTANNSHNYGHVGIVEWVDYSKGLVYVSEGWSRNWGDPSISAFAFLYSSYTFENINYTVDGRYSFNGYVFLLEYDGKNVC